MVRFIEKVKAKHQEFKNGQTLKNSKLNPEDFLTQIILPAIANAKEPNCMTNHDKSRHEQNKKDALESLKKAIVKAYYDARGGYDRVYFDSYEFETPYNKMLLWGIMFHALYQVLYKDRLNPQTVKLHKIKAEKYEKLPKRYRGIFAKDSIYQEKYVTEITPKDEDFYISCYDYETSQENTIEPLLKIVYKPVTVTTGITLAIGNEGNIDSVTQEQTQQVFANNNSRLSLFVSNEQIDAINKLQKIFQQIASACVIKKVKHGNEQVLAELKDEQERKNIFVRAQKVTRTANQLIVSTRKADEFCDDNDINEATKNYYHLKHNVMTKLYKKVHKEIQK